MVTILKPHKILADAVKWLIIIVENADILKKAHFFIYFTCESLEEISSDVRALSLHRFC